MNSLSLYDPRMKKKPLGNYLDELLRKTMEDFMGSFDTTVPTVGNTSTVVGRSAVSVVKGDGQTTIEIEMPGTKPADVEVTYGDNIVEVAWKARNGPQSRSFRVSNVDVSSAKATVVDGLFTLVLKRLEKANVNKIPVV